VKPSSSRRHVLIAIGTRPEAIKMSPLIRELQRRQRRIDLTVCATAQHRMLLDQVVDLLGIPIDIDLDVMTAGQTLEALTSRILDRMAAVLTKTQPDIVLVQGDTTTAFAVSLASFYHRIPVGHVEAGLRTGDPLAPFPEELNRRLTAQLARLHFAPTRWARANLLAEGIPSSRIFVTGNTVVDAFLQARRLVRRRRPDGLPLNGLADTRRKLLLVTAHRRENFGSPLEEICCALRDLATRRDDIVIVYPVHPNPHVSGPVKRILGELPRMHLLEPLEYLPFVWLMNRAYLVLTDSGGIQEEMPSLGRPVLILRDKTERPEGVEAGVCQLVGTRADAIQRAVIRLLDNPQAYRRFARRRNPFGDGRAAGRIADHLERSL
jgi:UDP-N-acetylglucosamine 2-epimerase (non-hydrolysing)